MTLAIPRRVLILRELAKKYYPLTSGHFIEKPNELLRVTDIESTKHEDHPHKAFRVYITKRALKHIVEKRKQELSKNHEEADILSKICSAVEQIPEIIANFDKYEYEHDPQKYFYTKHYAGNPSIRILCELSRNRNESLEICSIHFTKQKRDR